MSQMLDALKRIESKNSTASNENGDSPPTVEPAVEQSLRLSADPDGPTDSGETDDSGETNDCVDPPTTLTLQFGTSAECIQADPSHRFNRRWGKSADRDYLELATTVTGQLSKNPEAAILFTSPLGGEGKTNTVMGLAEVLACQDSGEVLAVDANPGLGGLTDQLEIDPTLGLVDVLSGEASWPDVIRATEIGNLSVLPGRAVSSSDVNPADGTQLPDLLSELRREFRLVIFDGASVCRPGVARMSRYFDAVYLVIELHRTSRNEAKQAVRIIDDFGGRLFGCVPTNQVRAAS
jgi:protein-tyrosine kinase